MYIYDMMFRLNSMTCVKAYFSKSTKFVVDKAFLYMRLGIVRDETGTPRRRRESILRTASISRHAWLPWLHVRNQVILGSSSPSTSGFSAHSTAFLWNNMNIVPRSLTEDFWHVNLRWSLKGPGCTTVVWHLKFSSSADTQRLLVPLRVSPETWSQGGADTPADSESYMLSILVNSEWFRKSLSATEEGGKGLVQFFPAPRNGLHWQLRLDSRASRSPKL